MSRWSLSDRLGVFNLAVGVIGLIAICAQALPGLLPEAVVVVDNQSDHMAGLTTATTTFQNVSFKSPVLDLQAEWQVDGDAVTVAVDAMAPRNELSASGRRKMLRLLDDLPARYSFKTVFNSARPFTIYNFYAHAARPVIDAVGSRKETVPVLPRALYETLLAERKRTFFVVLAGWAAFYAFLVYITGYLLGKSSRLREAHHGKQPPNDKT